MALTSNTPYSISYPDYLSLGFGSQAAISGNNFAQCNIVLQYTRSIEIPDFNLAIAMDCNRIDFDTPAIRSMKRSVSFASCLQDELFLKKKQWTTVGNMFR